MCLPFQPASVLLNDAVFPWLVPPALTRGALMAQGELPPRGASRRVLPAADIPLGGLPFFLFLPSPPLLLG